MGIFNPAIRGADDYTAQDYADAGNAALIFAGLGMMGGRGNAWDKLSRGGMFGMQAYQGALDARDKKRQQDAKLEDERQQAAMRELQMQKMREDFERQKKLDEIRAAAAQASQPIAALPVDDNGLSMPPPPQMPNQDERIIRMFMDAGFQKEAEDRLKIMQGLEGKAHGSVEVDKDGKPYYMTDRGPRYASGGFVPREKLVSVDMGGQIGFRPEHSANIVGSVAKTMTPDAIASNNLGWANLNLAKQRFGAEEQQRERGQFVNDFNTPNGPTPGFVTGDGVFRPAQGGAPKENPLTESQGAATAFGMRAKSANEVISQLEANGAPLGSLKGMLAENRFTNPAAPDWAQQAAQAKLNFMSAVLRKESGAVISATEYATEDRKYFPQPGDGDDVKEQKRKARELAVQALSVQAGPGARRIGNAPSSPAAAPSVGRRGSTSVTVGGVTYQFPSGALAEAFKMEMGIK